MIEKGEAGVFLSIQLLRVRIKTSKLNNKSIPAKKAHGPSKYAKTDASKSPPRNSGQEVHGECSQRAEPNFRIRKIQPSKCSAQSLKTIGLGRSQRAYPRSLSCLPICTSSPTIQSDLNPSVSFSADTEKSALVVGR